VQRKLILAVIVLLLVTSVASPFVERVDHFDRFSHPGNDTILVVISFLVFAGIWFIRFRLNATLSESIFDSTWTCKTLRMSPVPGLNPRMSFGNTPPLLPLRI